MQPAQVSQSFAQQPAFGMGGGGGGGGSESEQGFSVSEAPQVEEQLTTEVSDEAAEALPAEPLPVEPLPAGTESQLKAAVPNPTPTVQPQLESLRKAPEAEQPSEVASDETAGAKTRASVITFIGGLQIILAILAITTGLIAFYFRRSTR